VDENYEIWSINPTPFTSVLTLNPLLRSLARSTVLDYVFYDDTFDLVGRLDLPTSLEELGESALPSETWPSDHLLLFAELCLV
jgi:hypothetical protein